MQNPKVFVKFLGEDSMRARLIPHGEKVLFEPGDVYLVDFVKAKALQGHYKKFRIMQAEELTADEISHATEYEDMKKKQKEEVEENLKLAAEMAKKEEKEEKKEEEKIEKEEKEEEVEETGEGVEEKPMKKGRKPKNNF
jgi:ABC-type proline/glycine betaine transport system ATPase subunit